MTPGQGHGPFDIVSQRGMSWSPLPRPHSAQGISRHTRAHREETVVVPSTFSFGVALGVWVWFRSCWPKSGPHLWLGLDEDDRLVQKVLELGRRGGAKGYHLFSLDSTWAQDDKNLYFFFFVIGCRHPRFIGLTSTFRKKKCGDDQEVLPKYGAELAAQSSTCIVLETPCR